MRIIAPSRRDAEPLCLPLAAADTGLQVGAGDPVSAGRAVVIGTSSGAPGVTECWAGPEGGLALHRSSSWSRQLCLCHHRQSEGVLVSCARLREVLGGPLSRPARSAVLCRNSPCGGELPDVFIAQRAFSFSLLQISCWRGQGGVLGKGHPRTLSCSTLPIPLIQAPLDRKRPRIVSGLRWGLAQE